MGGVGSWGTLQCVFCGVCVAVVVVSCCWLGRHGRIVGCGIVRYVGGVGVYGKNDDSTIKKTNAGAKRSYFSRWSKTSISERWPFCPS